VSEDETLDGELVPDDQGRPLPVKRASAQIEPVQVAGAALAAAGGIVAGAATVAAVRAARGGSRRRPARKRSQRQAGVVASRSFLIDVHLLDR
jgi:hypothetical protein